MVHRDHETRIGAHRIFSVVLVPSSVCPQQTSSVPASATAAHIQRTLSRNVSVFSSSAAIFKKIDRKKPVFPENISEKTVVAESPKTNDSSIINRLKSSYSRAQSKRKPSSESIDMKDSKISSPSMMKRLKSRATSMRKSPSTRSSEQNPSSPDKQMVILKRLLFFISLAIAKDLLYHHRLILTIFLLLS